MPLSKTPASEAPASEIHPPTAGVALDQIEVFAEGLDHPEGIVALGELLYVSGEEGQIYEVNAHGDFRQVGDTGGGLVLGLAADAAGLLYVCDAAHGRLLRLDPADGSIETLADAIAGRPMVNPNWAAFGPDGSLYLTDSGTWGARNGVIAVLRSTGKAEMWSSEVPGFTNGIAVAADGRTVFGVESNPGRLFAIPVREDGTAGTPAELCYMGPAFAPDGVAVCTDGSLVIGCYRPDAIYRWSAEQGLHVLAADPQGIVLAAPANIAFTGPGGRTLVATNHAYRHLARADFGLSGLPLFRPSFGVAQR